MTDLDGRWTARRKTAIVSAVLAGEMTAADATQKHGIAAEELEGWLRDHLRRRGSGRSAHQTLAPQSSEPN